MNKPMPNSPEVLLVIKGLQDHLEDHLDDHFSPALAQKIRTFDRRRNNLTEAEFRVASSVLIRYMHFLAE